MALVSCKDCGNEVSDSAASCPKCGSIVLFISLIVVNICVRRLKKGELWFRSTNIGTSA
ncbi:MAG: zinc-ribbon domain-containing protein [Gammaproteobacteria bacterium]|nr:zinc-ribbon domain-containing protein [Gammaproteobacteria bacterium]